MDLTPDDIAGIIQRRCRQIIDLLDRQDIPVEAVPMIVMNAAGSVHDLGRSMMDAIYKAQAQQVPAEAPPVANGEAKAH